MTLARSIKPASTVSLPVIGGARGTGHVTLGPGHPNLVVFLASWDQEISDMPGELRASRPISARRCVMAGHRGHRR